MSSKTKKKGKAAAAKKASTAKVGEKLPRVTVSSYARELILSNPDEENSAIFKKLQQHFPKLEDRHANYIPWYRNQLRNQGKLPKAEKVKPKGAAVSNKV
jgi:hypothetical protein